MSAKKKAGPGRPPKPDRLAAQVTAGVSSQIKAAVQSFQQQQGFRSESNAVAELLRRALIGEGLLK